MKNGYFESLDNVTYNATVVYKCFDGFVMNGTNTSTCQHDGQWSPAGSCFAEDCEKVTEISNGSYNFTIGFNNSHGTIVKYFCNPGFDLIGSEQIVCLHDKTWSHSAPFCKKLTCSLPLVQFGYYSTSNWTIEYNESVRLHCYDGFKNNGTNTTEAELKCNEDRKLNFEDSCIDMDECAELSFLCTNNSNFRCQNIFGSYNCVCKDGYNLTDSQCLDIDECRSNTPICHQQCTNLDGSYNCSCDDGFDLYTANNTNGFILPAGEDGTKPGHVYHINHTCVPKTCEPLPLIMNGTVLSKKDRFLYKDTIKIVCDFGFQLNGSPLAYCNSNGSWSFGDTNIPPACIVIECPLPPKSQLELSHDPPNSSFIKAGESLTIVCEQQCENCASITKNLHCAPNSNMTFSLQGDNPHCFAVNCGDVPWTQIPGVVSKVINDTTYGSFFEFECNSDKGYTVKGNSSLGNATVMCQRNEHWGLNSLTCQGSSCSAPNIFAGTEQNVQYSYEIGQSVHYKCIRPGYKTKTNDTLHCLFSNGTAYWSGEAPLCEDAEQPNITCPKMPVFNLYDTLIYNLPNKSDNSGYACMTLESGPPSGVSVVTKNMTLIFRVFDFANNNKTFSCDVILKDQISPWIQCPGSIDYDMGDKLSKVFTEDDFKLHINHSSDGNVTFTPSQLNVTLGNIYNVTVNIKKDNGYTQECSFLIRPTTHSCYNETLTQEPLTNVLIKECNGTKASMTCQAHCYLGYHYQDLTTFKTYECKNGNWSTKIPFLPCLKMTNTMFYYNISAVYSTNGIIPKNKSMEMCFPSHENNLTNLIYNLNACNLSEYSVKHITSSEIGPEQIRSNFQLLVMANGTHENILQNCASELANVLGYFGPTFPNPSDRCLSPWKVSKSTVTPGKLFCESGQQILNETFCLYCGPGYYLNNGNCTECPNGTYQDSVGKTLCNNCSSNKSYAPRTSAKHCFG
uniref:Sushi, von Willebrand factor type A, EGF and pentraxin domain-containing protein 1 n=1 Tax=Biomphalaria glabrata TaxID=6526 RepID=A0A2C9LVK6_BIOGL